MSVGQDPQLDNRSLGELAKDLTEQTAALARQEARLAQLELQAKAKNAGVGIGLFGGAGILGLYGIGALLAAAAAGLATGMAVWAAILIVAGVVLAVAGVLALAGKGRVGRATPPLPEVTVETVRQDIQTVKESAHR